MIWCALDIETCPLPEADLSDTALLRLDRETERRQREAPDLSPEAARSKAASLHPLLGYVCNVTLAWGRDGAAEPTPRSFQGATVADEARLLADLWKHLGTCHHEARRRDTDGILWITFNGKAFDVPFLRLRSHRYDLRLPPLSLFDTNPYHSRPHWDLFCDCRPFAMGLADLCALMNLPSPKLVLGGDGVAAAMHAGDLDAVADYARADALATYELARLLQNPH